MEISSTLENTAKDHEATIKQQRNAKILCENILRGEEGKP